MRGRTFGEAHAGRANNFDFLRFAFATLVLFSHSYALAWGTESKEFVSVHTGGLIGGGSFAVECFFLISGYLVTASWLNSHGLLDYLKKRCLRIYPGFVLNCLLCALIVGPLAADSVAGYVHGFHPGAYVRGVVGLNMLKMPDVAKHNPLHGGINGSLWTIRYEFICYLYVALLGLTAAYHRRIAPVVFAAVFYALYLWQALFAPSMGRGVFLSSLGEAFPWPRLALFFALGMVFYLYRDRIKFSTATFLATLGGLIAAWWISSVLFQVVLPLAVTYLVLSMAYSRRVRLYRFARRGDLSYGMYLYAFPVQQLLVLYLPGRLTPGTLFLLAFPITCALAALSWHLVEGPCMKLKRRIPREAVVEQPAAKPASAPTPG